MACDVCKTNSCTGCKDNSITLPPSLKTGEKGDTGAAGASSYTYIAYADSNTGGNFSLTPFEGATYISVKTTTTEQTNDVNLHAGNWALFYSAGLGGSNGADGADGRGISTIELTDGNSAPGTTDTYTITYSDATTSTFTVTNGANGSTGPAGDSIDALFGAANPLVGDGEDGDIYINTTSGDIFKKASGAWSLQGNLKGATGATGATGAQGPAGTAANTNYAAMKFDADDTIAVTSTPTDIIAWDAAVANTYTTSALTGEITPTEAVSGFVDFSISGTSSVESNNVYTIEVYNNGSTTGIKAIATFGSGTKTLSARYPIEVSTNDDLTLRISNSSNANFTIKAGTFSFEAR